MFRYDVFCGPDLTSQRILNAFTVYTADVFVAENVCWTPTTMPLFKSNTDFDIKSLMCILKNDRTTCFISPKKES